MLDYWNQLEGPSNYYASILQPQQDRADCTILSILPSIVISSGIDLLQALVS